MNIICKTISVKQYNNLSYKLRLQKQLPKACSYRFISNSCPQFSSTSFLMQAANESI